MWAAPVGYANPPIMLVYGEKMSDGDDADTVVLCMADRSISGNLVDGVSRSAM